MIDLKIKKCPFDDDIEFFREDHIEFDEGLTVLVGCNGIGKTTILNKLKKKYAEDDQYTLVKWDGRYDKDTIRDSVFRNDLQMFADMWGASEGEEINNNICVIAQQIGYSIRNSKGKDIIILLDCLDSGLSIDLIRDIKHFLKDTVVPDVHKENRKCYIIASANEYELACGERCFDVRNCKMIDFENYEDYRNFILQSREYKNER